MTWNGAACTEGIQAKNGGQIKERIVNGQMVLLGTAVGSVNRVNTLNANTARSF